MVSINGKLFDQAAQTLFIGFFFWNTGLAMGGIARVSQTQLLQTFITLGVAALALGEVIDLSAIVFAVTVVAVVAIGTRFKAR
jgi:drug/metabolite transporter (DMT)-like permease